MKVAAWLILEGTPNRYGSAYPNNSPYAGQLRLDSIKVKGVTQNKPNTSDKQITMRIELDVDESWFLDGVATIKAVVPKAPTSAAEIQATVDMPVKPRGKSKAAAVIP